MINPTTEFIIGLFLLVACAVLVGEVFTHLGQAALVGQLLVGVALGPTLLGPSLGLTAPTVVSELSGLQTLATFFILLMAGLSLSPEALRATGVQSALLGIAMFFVPFLFGAGLVRLVYPADSPLVDLFFSLTIAITALPVLGIMLREFDLLDTKFGVTLLNGSVVNELCAVTVFAILLRFETTSGGVLPNVEIAVGTVLLFLGTIVALYLLLRWLGGRPGWKAFVRRFRAEWNTREAGFALLIVVGLACALYSQYLGLTFILGAFYAGILITPEVAGEKVHRAISGIFDAVSWGFFIPLFFALVGFDTDFRLIGSSYVALAAFVAIVLFAVTSKFLVGAAVGRSLRWSGDESFAAGFFVTSRGAVELAMAVILVSLGVFDQTQFTSVAGAGLLATFVSPIGARPFVTAMKSAAHRIHRAPQGPPPQWVGTVYLPPRPDPVRPPLPPPSR
jgi:Kef-type K+ transport system membrane component KefB